MKYWELTIYYNINRKDKPPFEMRDSVAIRHKSLATVCKHAREFHCPANIYCDWLMLNYRDSEEEHKILYSYDCWKGKSSITKTLLTKMGVEHAADIQKKD